MRADERNYCKGNACERGDDLKTTTMRGRHQIFQKKLDLVGRQRGRLLDTVNRSILSCLERFESAF